MRKFTTAELVAAKPPAEEFWRLPRHPIYVVCDNVRSLENVGLIFRVCDAVRVARLYLCGITGYPPMPAGDPRPPWVAERAARIIAKTAIQTIPWVPWEYRADARRLVGELKSAGVQIVSLEQTDESVDYTAAPYRFPVCLVVGHEREGVEQEVLQQSDVVVQIPIYGMGNSLNVASALSVIVYELVRPERLAAAGIVTKPLSPEPAPR